MNTWSKWLKNYFELVQKDLWRRRAKRRRERVARHTEGLENRTLLAAIISWTNPSGGNWNTPGNWDLGRVPTTGDDVVIPNVAGNQTINFSSGNISVNSITASEQLTISGGNLNISAALSDTAGINIEGGTLSHATVAASTTIVSSFAGEH